jgi:Ca-activated chloride channel homolog
MIAMKRSISAIAWLALAATAPVEAQQQSPAPTYGESISVGYVLVNFAAVDGKGRPLRNLEKNDVQLLIDGQPVATDMFDRSEDAPISFTILLDGSGSMGLAGKMEGARAAINALLDNRLRGDDFALYVFAAGAVREVVPFTESKREILKGFDSVKPFGKTAFFDALAEMPDKSLLGRNGARAIVLLTDGLDNASTMSRSELTKILEGVNVPVYPLGLRPQPASRAAESKNPEELTDLEILDYVARLSGGRLAVALDPPELARAIDNVEKDLRSQFMVGFTPTGRGEVRYRRISVAVRGKTRGVRVRAGYRGTEPPLIASAAPAQRGRPAPKARGASRNLIP